MASEQLNIPEEHLLAVIKVIRAGLCITKVDPEVREQLQIWCDEEEAYMIGGSDGDTSSAGTE